MKTVIITGSTRGIGRGLAENFLKRGCKVVITARKQDQVDAVVADLASQYGQTNVTGIACDVQQHEHLEALWQHAVKTYTSIDIWINNAGMSLPRKPLEQQAVSDISNIINTNLTGVILATSVALKGMKAQNHGQIWNMEGFGSNGATQPGMAIYGATKRAVTYLNKSLQKEVKGTQVQVNTLSPGIVVTDLLIGDYDTASPEWLKVKKIFNILGDKVETVTPWLVNGILAANKSGATVAWLTGGKAFWRFMTAAFNKRDLFADVG
ncbi:SDR family NAD(P)-dependent oxidoreductase [Paraglaciecola hydrolytica]|uniref:Chitin-binding protein n=1 Tax=Paraglaciecola hydrolytica TaxID=1799789 RepID=A0A136A5D9_9ALTE|nr:SDR family oxidoreductase [Paraglaciecola hydrolytica]KXI30424.1 chitin-binding protein [Paraglaciecola hydrolytica]